MTTVTVRASLPAVLDVLRRLPALLAGDDSGLSAEVLDAVGTEAMRLLAERFDVLSDGGSYEGETWPPLSPATVARKENDRRRKFGTYPDDIGIMTGAMRRAFDAGDRSAPGQVFRVDSSAGAVEVGCDLPQAGPFHRGSESRNQPARPLVPRQSPREWSARLRRAFAEAYVRAAVKVLTGHDLLGG